MMKQAESVQGQTRRTNISVLVTGVGGGSFGHELVKALRLAGGYHLIGVDMTPAGFGLFDVDEAYTVPSARHPDYISILLDLCLAKRVQVVIPGSEPELIVVSRNRERFSERGILPLVNDADVIATGLDKHATMEFLDKSGFQRPRSLMIAAHEDIPRDFVLPAIVKPATGGGGSSDTFVVQAQDELEFVCTLLLRQGRTVMLQEYVGTPEDEFTVGVLHALDGTFVGSIALRREIMGGLSNRIKAPNRTPRSDLGPVLAVSSGISQGVIADFPEVREQCEAIARALGSRGPLNIQGRFANGVFILFEINPRFSGTTYLRALAGYNEPDMLIGYHLRGEAFTQPVPYASGQIVRGLVERRVADFQPVAAWDHSAGHA